MSDLDFKVKHGVFAGANASFLNYIARVDGTAAAPTYTFESDPDTGLARTADNTLAIITAGTIAGTFTAAGFRANLNASDLTTGTVPNARVTGAYTGFTNITASDTVTVPTVRATTIVATANANNKFVSNNTSMSIDVGSADVTLTANQLSVNVPTQSNTFTSSIGGTAALPAYTFDSGAIGFYSSNTNELSVSVNGVRVGRFITGGFRGDINADDLTNGTVPNARITGEYTGFTNISGAGTSTFPTVRATTVAATSNTSNKVEFSNTGVTVSSATTKISVTNVAVLSDTVVRAPSFTTSAGGTAALPAYTFDSGAIGLYSANTNELSVSVNGAQVGRFLTSGFRGALNGADLTAGVIPSARLTGAYTNFTNITGSGTLTIPTGNITNLSVDNLISRTGAGNTYRITANASHWDIVTANASLMTFSAGGVAYRSASPRAEIDFGAANTALVMPTGTTDQRPTGVDGMLRFNATMGEFEGYSTTLGGWSQLSLAGSSINANFLEGQNGAYYRNLANATGTLAAARFTDTSHGTRGGGTLHANATPTVDGFMSAADKTKFDAFSIDDWYFKRRGSLAANTDLGAYITNGIYQATNATAAGSTGYPVNLGGLLHVTKSSGSYIHQEYQANNRRQFTRSSATSGTTWSDWAEQWSSSYQGVGTGMDADLLDGQQGDYYRDLTNATGTLPVAQVAGLDTALTSYVLVNGSRPMTGNLTIAKNTPELTLEGAGNRWLTFKDANSVNQGAIVSDASNNRLHLRAYTLGSATTFQQVYLEANGQFILPQSPTTNNSAATKAYVDAGDSAITSATDTKLESYVLVNGSRPMTGTLTVPGLSIPNATYPQVSFRDDKGALSGSIIHVISDGTLSLRTYDSAGSTTYSEAALTRTGQLRLPNAPINDSSATRKDYVDNLVATSANTVNNANVSKAGDTMTGNLRVPHIYVGASGEVAQDGNIRGSRWEGQWLYDYLHNAATSLGGRAYPRRSDGGAINFAWSGKGGQPTWLWGGSDGTNMYVYNPGNFSVNYANSAGNSNTVGGWSQETIAGAINWRVSDTRFAGYIERTTTGTAGVWYQFDGGYVCTGYRFMSSAMGTAVNGLATRQPQIHIPNVGWRSLGGW